MGPLQEIVYSPITVLMISGDALPEKGQGSRTIGSTRATSVFFLLT